MTKESTQNGLINIDTSGVSEGLARLVTIVDKTLGTLAATLLAGIHRKQQVRHITEVGKAETDNTVYAIEQIGKAVADKDPRTTVSLRDGKLEMVRTAASDNAGEGVVERAAQRRLHQEVRKQRNIEAVLDDAVEALLVDGAVEPGTQPDEDWIARFFEVSSGFSNEMMQKLWGKLLADEIRRPGSFSLRTIELLKNITSEEARLFANVANFVADFNGEPVIPIPRIQPYVGIPEREIVRLVSAGLLAGNVFEAGNRARIPSSLIFTFDEEQVELEFVPDASLVLLGRYNLTTEGGEILPLIPRSFDRETFDRLFLGLQYQVKQAYSYELTYEGNTPKRVESSRKQIWPEEEKELAE